MGKLIDADKLLAWLKIREGEAYTNADQVFNPSFLLGKADAFNDVVEYVKSGHSDLAPSPTIKPGDKVRIISALSREWIGREAVVKEVYTEPFLHFSLDIGVGHWTPSCLEVIESD